MKLKPYPKYKDSGIQWLGEIPEAWEVRRIDKLSSVRRGASPRPIEDPKYFDNNGEYSWVRIADVTASDRYLIETTEKLSVLGKSLSVPLLPGRLFISIAGTVGKPIITKIKCCIHDGFVYFQNLKIVNEYLYYIFIGGQAYLGLGKWGTQLNLNTETIGLISIPLPPESEQHQIVHYLDKQTSKIDRTIQKDKQLIELLKEKRAALINHVVTKGLDPDVKIKESGIDWIGDIPEGWEVHRLRYIIKNGIEGIKIGPFGSMLKSDIIVSKGYKVYGQENVINSDFEKGGRFISNDKYKELIGYQIFSGDLVVTMMGTTGKAQIVPENIVDGIMDSHLIRLRFNKKAYPKFIEILINSSEYIFGELKYFSKGAIMEGLNSGIIKGLIIAIPPKTEQKRIIEFLAKRTSRIDKIIQKIEKKIELLEEYKKSLIHNVIIGKIDVRSVAA